MIPTLLVILVYIVGPIAILVWAVKRYRHGAVCLYCDLEYLG